MRTWPGSCAKAAGSFCGSFESLAGPEHGVPPADLCGAEAFARSKLDLDERRRHAAAYALHRDLLRLQREDAVFSAQRGDRVHGAVLAPEATSAILRRGRRRPLIDCQPGARSGLDIVAEPLAAAARAAASGNRSGRAKIRVTAAAGADPWRRSNGGLRGTPRWC